MPRRNVKRMDDKPAPTKPDQQKAYLFVGIVFLAAGVVFIFTSMSALWISMFVLGIVFITLSATLKPKATTTPDEPDSPPAKQG
jgi:hypothetical protein